MLAAMTTHSMLERQRTHTCGGLRVTDAGSTIVLMGWVDRLHDKGGRVFLDLRDRHGMTQVVFKPEVDAALAAAAGQLGREYCVAIAGVVEDRVKNGGTVNPKLATGAVEVAATSLEVFNPSALPPFMIEDNVNANEDLLLTHRVLDLRRPHLQRNLAVRHRIMQATRKHFDENGFLEMETPLLVKYTPGGARNFLVPSRLNPGKFYALAESPQLYKQMFMMAGLDRYFQIVKCFRDEDLRGDRQPEFTQIDVEISFATESVVQTLIEGLIARIFKDTLNVTLATPFQRMTYDVAMAKYGVDKPDLRFGLEHTDLTAVLKQHDGGGVPMFKAAIDGGGIVKAMCVPKQHELSRSDVDKLEEDAKRLGAKGLARAKVGDDGVSWTQSALSKNITPAAMQAIHTALGAQPGDVLLFQFGDANLVHSVLGGLRLVLRDKLKLVAHDDAGVSKEWKVLWVTDFPLFEHDADSNTYVAAHHPFTSPQKGHEDLLLSNPGACKARAYDLVLNGNEVGGGSIRIHDSAVQAKVFGALGISDEDKQKKFGFLLEALKYGCPPHGGIALGLDRLCMLLSGGKSLRDVIAYPKTARGTDLLTDAPTVVSDKQLSELFISSTAKT
jgi:aspartyl-tRNA synthetase